MENASFFETLAEKAKNKIIEYKVPLISSLVIGLFTYFYVFTNKLVNPDDIQYLFAKGETTSSGRWGLDLLSYIFPDYSMPWFHGIITILFMSVAICVIINIFKIKSKLLQILLSGVIISFLSLTVTFGYMFTSSSYAVSFLCGVLAVKLVKEGGKLNFALGAASFIFSLSIYQAYIAVVSSLFLVLLIQDILKNEKSSKQIFIDGIKYLAFLGISIAAYWCITKVLMKLLKVPFNEYAKSRMSLGGISSVINGIKNAYMYFYTYFVPDNRVFHTTLPSEIIHILLVLIIVVKLVISQIKNRDILKSLILLLCVGLLPLSINCFHLFTYVHIVMLYGFIAIYILAAVIIEELPAVKPKKDIVHDLVLVSLAVLVFTNAYIANRFYLQMQLIYDNTFSFYTSIATQIKDNPQFTEGTKISLIGKTDNLLYDFEDFERIYSFDDVINSYSREDFIKYYLGFDAQFATEDENEIISQTQQFKNMAKYPYYGSVEKIDNYLVFKFGEFERIKT